MMPKRLQNKLKWIAELQTVRNDVDADDRPVVIREKKRKLFYADIGVNAQEKFLSLQNKTEVVRRIKIRLDREISEKSNGVRISGVDYNIIRIYTDVNKREMELSLTYVD